MIPISFFDSKSFTPKTDIRKFSQKALDEDIKRIAEACAQMYKHIRNRFPNEYCYFEKAPKSKPDNIFGLVVLQENPYIRGNPIYKKTAEILKISEDSDEYLWLCAHVGISSIQQIERYCFTETNMIPQLQKVCEEKVPTHEWLTGETGKITTYKRYRNYIGSMKEEIKHIADKLHMDNSLEDIS